MAVRRFNIFEIFFSVFPKLLEVLLLFTPVKPVSRPLHNCKNCGKNKKSGEKRRFGCKKVKLVDIW